MVRLYSRTNRPYRRCGISPNVTSDEMLFCGARFGYDLSAFFFLLGLRRRFRGTAGGPRRDEMPVVQAQKDSTRRLPRESLRLFPWTECEPALLERRIVPDPVKHRTFSTDGRSEWARTQSFKEWYFYRTRRIEVLLLEQVPTHWFSTRGLASSLLWLAMGNAQFNMESSIIF